MFEHLDTSRVSYTVAHIVQAAGAAMACNSGQAGALAQLALDVALECDDAPGKAAALAVQGVVAGDCERLAWAAREFGRDPSSIGQYNAAVCLAAIGALHRQAGELALALAHWQRALNTLNGCFWLLVGEGKVEQARALAEDVRRAISLAMPTVVVASMASARSEKAAHKELNRRNPGRVAQAEASKQYYVLESMT